MPPAKKKKHTIPQTKSKNPSIDDKFKQEAQVQVRKNEVSRRKRKGTIMRKVMSSTNRLKGFQTSSDKSISSALHTLDFSDCIISFGLNENRNNFKEPCRDVKSGGATKLKQTKFPKNESSGLGAGPEIPSSKEEITASGENFERESFETEENSISVRKKASLKERDNKKYFDSVSASRCCARKSTTKCRNSPFNSASKATLIKVEDIKVEDSEEGEKVSVNRRQSRLNNVLRHGVPSIHHKSKNIRRQRSIHKTLSTEDSAQHLRNELQPTLKKIRSSKKSPSPKTNCSCLKENPDALSIRSQKQSSQTNFNTGENIKSDIGCILYLGLGRPTHPLAYQNLKMQVTDGNIDRSWANFAASAVQMPNRGPTVSCLLVPIVHKQLEDMALIHLKKSLWRKTNAQISSRLTDEKVMLPHCKEVGVSFSNCMNRNIPYHRNQSSIVSLDNNTESSSNEVMKEEKDDTDIYYSCDDSSLDLRLHLTSDSECSVGSGSENFQTSNIDSDSTPFSESSKSASSERYHDQSVTAEDSLNHRKVYGKMRRSTMAKAIWKKRKKAMGQISKKINSNEEGCSQNEGYENSNNVDIIDKASRSSIAKAIWEKRKKATTQVSNKIDTINEENSQNKDAANSNIVNIVGKRSRSLIAKAIWEKRKKAMAQVSNKIDISYDGNHENKNVWRLNRIVVKEEPQSNFNESMNLISDTICLKPAVPQETERQLRGRGSGKTVMQEQPPQVPLQGPINISSISADKVATNDIINCRINLEIKQELISDNENLINYHCTGGSDQSKTVIVKEESATKEQDCHKKDSLLESNAQINDNSESIKQPSDVRAKFRGARFTKHHKTLRKEKRSLRFKAMWEKRKKSVVPNVSESDESLNQLSPTIKSFVIESKHHMHKYINQDKSESEDCSQEVLKTDQFKNLGSQKSVNSADGRITTTLGLSTSKIETSLNSRNLSPPEIAKDLSIPPKPYPLPAKVSEQSISVKPADGKIVWHSCKEFAHSSNNNNLHCNDIISDNESKSASLIGKEKDVAPKLINTETINKLDYGITKCDAVKRPRRPIIHSKVQRRRQAGKQRYLAAKQKALALKSKAECEEVSQEGNSMWGSISNNVGKNESLTETSGAVAQELPEKSKFIKNKKIRRKLRRIRQQQRYHNYYKFQKKVKPILNSIIDYVCRKEDFDKMKFDYDEDYCPPPDESIPETNNLPALIEAASISKWPSAKKDRCARELARLNVNLITIREKPTDAPSNMPDPCPKENCKFGCVCTTLSCKSASTVQRCSRESCIFGCNCNSLSIPKNLTGAPSILNPIMKKLQVESRKRLAVKEYRETIYVSDQKDQGSKIFLNNKRRDRKIPERFKDHYVGIDAIKAAKHDIVMANFLSSSECRNFELNEPAQLESPIKADESVLGNRCIKLEKPLQLLESTKLDKSPHLSQESCVEILKTDSLDCNALCPKTVRIHLKNLVEKPRNYYCLQHAARNCICLPQVRKKFRVNVWDKQIPRNVYVPAALWQCRDSFKITTPSPLCMDGTCGTSRTSLNLFKYAKRNKHSSYAFYLLNQELHRLSSPYFLTAEWISPHIGKLKLRDVQYGKLRNYITYQLALGSAPTIRVALQASLQIFTRSAPVSHAGFPSTISSATHDTSLLPDKVNADTSKSEPQTLETPVFVPFIEQTENEGSIISNVCSIALEEFEKLGKQEDKEGIENEEPNVREMLPVSHQNSEYSDSTHLNNLETSLPEKILNESHNPSWSLALRDVLPAFKTRHQWLVLDLRQNFDMVKLCIKLSGQNPVVKCFRRHLFDGLSFKAHLNFTEVVRLPLQGEIFSVLAVPGLSSIVLFGPFMRDDSLNLVPFQRVESNSLKMVTLKEIFVRYKKPRKQTVHDFLLVHNKVRSTAVDMLSKSKNPFIYYYFWEPACSVDSQDPKYPSILNDKAIQNQPEGLAARLSNEKTNFTSIVTSRESKSLPLSSEVADPIKGNPAATNQCRSRPSSNRKKSHRQVKNVSEMSREEIARHLLRIEADHCYFNQGRNEAENLDEHFQRANVEENEVQPIRHPQFSFVSVVGKSEDCKKILRGESENDRTSHLKTREGVIRIRGHSQGSSSKESLKIVEVLPTVEPDPSDVAPPGFKSKYLISSLREVGYVDVFASMTTSQLIVNLSYMELNFENVAQASNWLNNTLGKYVIFFPVDFKPHWRLIEKKELPQDWNPFDVQQISKYVYLTEQGPKIKVSNDDKENPESDSEPSTASVIDDNEGDVIDEFSDDDIVEASRPNPGIKGSEKNSKFKDGKKTLAEDERGKSPKLQREDRISGISDRDESFKSVDIEATPQTEKSVKTLETDGPENPSEIKAAEEIPVSTDFNFLDDRTGECNSLSNNTSNESEHTLTVSQLDREGRICKIREIRQFAESGKMEKSSEIKASDMVLWSESSLNLDGQSKLTSISHDKPKSSNQSAISSEKVDSAQELNQSALAVSLDQTDLLKRVDGIIIEQDGTTRALSASDSVIEDSSNALSVDVVDSETVEDLAEILNQKLMQEKALLKLEHAANNESTTNSEQTLEANQGINDKISIHSTISKDKKTTATNFLAPEKVSNVVGFLENVLNEESQTRRLIIRKSSTTPSLKITKGDARVIRLKAGGSRDSSSADIYKPSVNAFSNKPELVRLFNPRFYQNIKRDTSHPNDNLLRTTVIKKAVMRKGNSEIGYKFVPKILKSPLSIDSKSDSKPKVSFSYRSEDTVRKILPKSLGIKSNEDPLEGGFRNSVTNAKKTEFKIVINKNTKATTNLIGPPPLQLTGMKSANVVNHPENSKNIVLKKPTSGHPVADQETREVSFSTSPFKSNVGSFQKFIIVGGDEVPISSANSYVLCLEKKQNEIVQNGISASTMKERPVGDLTSNSNLSTNENNDKEHSQYLDSVLRESMVKVQKKGGPLNKKTYKKKPKQVDLENPATFLNKAAHKRATVLNQALKKVQQLQMDTFLDRKQRRRSRKRKCCETLDEDSAPNQSEEMVETDDVDIPNQMEEINKHSENDEDEKKELKAPLSTGSGVLESSLRFSLRNKRRKKEEDDESNAQQLSEEDKKIPEALSKEDKIKLHNAREVERRTELRQLGKKLLTVATENVLPQDRPQGRSIATLAILNVAKLAVKRMKVESEMLQIEHNILKSKNRFLSEKLKDLGAGKIVKGKVKKKPIDITGTPVFQTLEEQRQSMLKKFEARHAKRHEKLLIHAIDLYAPLEPDSDDEWVTLGSFPLKSEDKSESSNVETSGGFNIISSILSKNLSGL
nr:PREDICTED: uncharacterized protein LOC109034663 [Bemisia tabaci]